MARSKLTVGDWVQLACSYSGCRIGQLLEVPGKFYGSWRVATDAVGDGRGMECCREDIHSRAEGPPHAYFPMRKRLPYGRYFCVDGSYVFHNRDYKPIVRVHPDGSRSPCDPSEWIEHKSSEHFYNDLTSPWVDKATFRRIVAIIDGTEQPRPYNAADEAPMLRRLRRQDIEDQKRTDPFIGHAWHGKPYLYARKYRTIMFVSWSDGSLMYYREFADAIERSTMEADLMAIWKRCIPKLNRRASFGHGGVGGYMNYLPIDAGNEVLAVVRRHYIVALHEVRNRIEAMERKLH